VKLKIFTLLIMMLVQACNKSTCGPECQEAEEESVVSGAQTSTPPVITTTQAQTFPYCTTEGQGNCIVDGVRFKAVQPADIDPWDIRVGKTVAGVSGKLKVNCRNRIRSTAFNYDGDIAFIGNGSHTSGVTLDIWDTIDDYNNNVSGLPPDIALEWGSETDCTGVEISAGDDNVWKDVTTTIAAESSSCTIDSGRCTMLDKITGLWVSKIQTPGTGLSWDAAWRKCLELSHNAKDDWRLPTQKELLAIYLHGARSVASSNWISATKMAENFWSGTTVSSDPAYAYDVGLARSSVRNIYTIVAQKYKKR
jgi:hypothetical protein